MPSPIVTTSDGTRRAVAGATGRGVRDVIRRPGLDRAPRGPRGTIVRED